ncbi:transmembrane protein 177 isoform X2 [Spea bombifrons]|nr:transmembrane protein 177 isoform X2 [Spea bombifrons]
MATPFLWRVVGFTQRYRGRLLAVASAGLFSASISYHVFPEQTFRKLYQGWSKGEPVQLSAGLRSLFREVLQEAQITSASGYRPFAAFGFQPVGAGLPWLPGGCLIGIPANYNTSAAGNRVGIADRVLMVNGKQVDWRSEEGERLKDALILSPAAQKFSLAREALYSQSNGPVIKAVVAPFCFSGVCLSSVAIKQLLGLYTGPIVVRGLYNACVILLGITGYFLCDDAVTRWLDFRTDRKAAGINESYARGGLEFYDKVLARNRILRGLMGEEGERIYAPSGNLFPKHYLRLKYTPYTSRRNHIQQALDTQKV